MYDSITKEKKWGKKCLEICAIKGGGRTPNAILNFHFDFLTPSLIRNEKRMYSKKATPILVLDFFQANLFYFILKMSTLKGVQA